MKTWTSSRVVLAILLAAVLSGCNAATAPTPTAAAAAPAAAPPSPTVVLTVRVLVQGSQEPIPLATVFRNSAAIGQTNADGMLQAPVPLGVEFSIDVASPGFHGFGASGTVSSAESWTFYLERQ